MAKGVLGGLVGGRDFSGIYSLVNHEQAVPPWVLWLIPSIHVSSLNGYHIQDIDNEPKSQQTHVQSVWNCCVCHTIFR